MPATKRAANPWRLNHPHCHLPQVKDCQTLDEIKDTLLEAYEDLLGLDIFDGVEIVIDADNEVGPAWAGHWRGGAWRLACFVQAGRGPLLLRLSLGGCTRAAPRA